MQAKDSPTHKGAIFEVWRFFAWLLAARAGKPSMSFKNSRHAKRAVRAVGHWPAQWRRPVREDAGRIMLSIRLSAPQRRLLFHLMGA
jgi:hypothetical protein